LPEKQDDDPLSRHFEEGHLPKSTYVIDTGIGPRVRKKYQALIDLDADAVSHRGSSLVEPHLTKST
jgi:hypothetical protein